VIINQLTSSAGAKMLHTYRALRIG